MSSSISSNSALNRPNSMSFGQTHGMKKLPSASEETAGSQAGSTATFSKEAILRSLGDRYDPRAMSTSEMKSMAKEMRSGGLISEWEYASMTVELRIPGQEFDSNAKVDFISQYTAQIEYTKSILSQPGMKEQLASLEKIFNYLRNI